MKILAWILICFVAHSVAMESPGRCAALAPYISAARKLALENVRTEFQIADGRWAAFISIITQFHQQHAGNQKMLCPNELEKWHQEQTAQCDTALLHKTISAEEHGIFSTIIRAFTRRKIAPKLLKLESFAEPNKTIQTTEDVIYHTSIPGRARIDELAANVNALERRVIIQINIKQLSSFCPPFIDLAAEHEVGHYRAVDCITSSLLNDLTREKEIPDDQAFSSQSWNKLKELMEKEADDFMINGDAQRIHLAQKYCIEPGHWHFNLELLLFQACKTNQKTIVDELIADGVMVGARSADQHTPLHIAAYNGHDTIIKSLIAAGANNESVTDKNETPLHLACMAGKSTTAKLLLATYHCNPNARMAGGITPLMLAAHHGHMEIIELLLSTQAFINDRADTNKRAYHFAQNNNKHEAAHRLRAQESRMSKWWNNLWD